jgi:hypothetical protein
VGGRLCNPWRQGARDAHGGGDSSSRVVRPHAASTPQWCSRGGARRAQHSAGIAVVERKAGRTRGREGGMWEPQQSRSDV